METDTSASLSIVNDKTYAQLAKGTSPLVLQNTNLTLRTFSGELLKPMGVAKVTVKGKDGQPETLPLVVISENQPSLTGRNWLENLKLDWGSVHKIALLSQLEALLAGFGCLFKDELGSMKGVKGPYPDGSPCQASETQSSGCTLWFKRCCGQGTRQASPEGDYRANTALDLGHTNCASGQVRQIGAHMRRL